MPYFAIKSTELDKCLDKHDHRDSATAPMCEWVAQTPQLGLTKSATFFEVSFLLKLLHMCLLSQLALPSGLAYGSAVTLPLANCEGCSLPGAVTQHESMNCAHGAYICMGA